MHNLHNLSFFDLYEKNALFKGSSCAISSEEGDITYGELFSQAAGLACGLKSLNLPPGSRIAVLCRNHPVFFYLFGAASALNLVLVLINWRLAPEETAHIISDTSPCVIIADMHTSEQAMELADSFSCIRHCYIIDDEKNGLSRLYLDETLTDPVPCSSTDPFVIIHTAAMQGKPRGAVLSQENIILANQQIINAFSLGSSKTCLNILPLFHIMGINLGLGTLQAGGRNIVLKKFDPKKVLDLIQSHHVNLIGSFPPILTNLIDTIKTQDYDLSSLEIAAGLDMPDTIKQWQDITGSKFWTMYGQTETSGLITFTEYFAKPGSAGAVSALVNLKIADDNDRFLPPGETGEIIVRGPLVFQGYWNADELNAHTFRNGWHHTGDLGMLDDEGFLYFKGRKPEKELIKPGGENVFPAEVENALMEHEAVNEACVFGVPDPKFGEGIKAVCSLNKGYTLTKEELIRFSGSIIAGYKKPRYVEFVDELPKTADGAIDREKIKQEYA